MDLLTLYWTRFEHIRNQKLSREALEAKQLRKFRKLVAYAQAHSPYYARIIAESNIDPLNCTPENFPVLTKSEVMSNLDDIVTNRAITKKKLAEFLESSRKPLDLFENKYHVLHTSGSSGEVGFNVYSRKDFARGMAQALKLAPPGLKKKRIAYFAATEGHFAGVTTVAASMQFPLKYFYRTEMFEINKPLPLIVERLNSFQPHILIGYPHALQLLAEEQKTGRLNILPSLVQTSGEALSTTARAAIDNSFRARLLNSYMSTEHLYMGIGRPEDDGMYLLEDNLIFDVQANHVDITNLFN